MALARFMASWPGRGLRITLGLVLIALGFGVIGGTGGLILGLAGLLPISAGALDVCLFAPLFGAPLRGADLTPVRGRGRT